MSRYGAPPLRWRIRPDQDRHGASDWVTTGLVRCGVDSKRVTIALDGEPGRGNVAAMADTASTPTRVAGNRNAAFWRRGAHASRTAITGRVRSTELAPRRP